MDERTKENAGRNEVQDIANIIDSINSKNPCGLKIISAFASKFPGRDIIASRARTGTNRGVHYDFQILVRSEKGDEWKSVEHKGSKKCTEIKPTDTPWSAGVQFHNGGCEKYSITKKYAQLWYNTYIQSDTLRTQFGLLKPTPTFDDWYLRDCKVQDDPKTEFGKELKSVVRSLRGKRGSLLEKRKTVNDTLVINEEDKRVLLNEVLPIANHALQQKDYWLTIRGDLYGEFECAWYPQFTISKINEVVVVKNKDIEFTFNCNDDFTFHGILRWGKGAGLSNLRLDLK